MLDSSIIQPNKKEEHPLEQHLPEFLVSINELLLTEDVTEDTLRQAQSFIDAANNIIVGDLASKEEGIKVKKAIENLKEWMIRHTLSLTS